MPAGTTGRVEVREEETGGYELWTEVPNFDASSRDDRHYVLDASSGVVRFGDGKHGKIPRALTLAASNDPQAFERNLRATEYRWGGGARANAGANTISGLQSSAAFVDRVTNLRPSVGGADAESLDAAKQRAPMTIRTMSRAVTPEDFAFLAQQTPGALISRAQAFPLLNPMQRVKRSGDGANAPELPLPGVVTVVVVPESTNPRPTPSADTLRLVADWLDSHRLLTTELYVCAPRYRQVHIRAQVLASPSADSGVVERTLRQRLLDYFHPLRGGRKGTGWEFGQTIDFSETYGHILNTPGVVSIRTDSFRTFVDDDAVLACTDVPLEPDELVYSIDHEVEVSYA
jgi:predicted phage baseplate assembly protein